MNEDTALSTINQGSALDIYGSGDDIKIMAERIKLCLPGGEKLSIPERLALAQLSVAYELNPFNGEVWYIPGKGPMVGIKGHRKASRRQGQYWTEHILLTQDERESLGVPEGAIAYKCLVYRSDMIRQSAEAIKLMYDAGMKDAAERYAYKPTVGIGYWTRGESTRMKPDQAARKRAEADALKQAFDLPFGSEPGNGDRVGYADPEWDISETRAPSSSAGNAGRVLYGERDFEGFDTGNPGDIPDGEYTEAPPDPEPPKQQPKAKAVPQQQVPANDGYGPNDIKKRLDALLTELQAHVGHYKNTADLFRTMKEIRGADFGWPPPQNDTDWAVIRHDLADHAATQAEQPAQEGLPL